MLEFKNITAAYHQGFPILDHVNLKVGDGENIALLGRNGAGKTTFANTIFINVPIIQGEIEFNGIRLSSLPVEKRASLGIGYFMQGAVVFPQMTVKENLLVASGDKGKHYFVDAMKEMKITFPFLKEPAFEQMPAGSLSGGERTQLCLAMAMINKPSLLILDEPFAGLSPANSNIILQALTNYHQEIGASIVLIAQDRHMASGFCDKNYVIRNGKIIKE
ncbi:MAG: ATP-binding cassette domain-containing protein [Bacteroidota bacterium]